MDIKLYTDIPLVKDLVILYGNDVKINNYIDVKVLTLYLQFKNKDPPIHIEVVDIYNYIKFIHFILMDNDHYAYIAKYITKDNFYSFEDLFKNPFIENDLLLLIDYDVVKMYPRYKDIETQYIKQNFCNLMIYNKDVLYKYILYEHKYTYCEIDSVLYVYVHNNFKHSTLFKTIPNNLLSEDVLSNLTEDYLNYSLSESPILELVKYMISLGVKINEVSMISLVNFLEHVDIVKYIIEEVKINYNIFSLFDMSVYLGYSETIYYLVNLGNREININYITVLVYDDFHYINNNVKVEMIDCLINIGVDLFSNNNTILCYYIENKNINIIKKLLTILKNIENYNSVLIVKRVLDADNMDVFKAFEEINFNFKVDIHYNVKYCRDNNLNTSLKYLLKAAAAPGR